MFILFLLCCVLLINVSDGSKREKNHDYLKDFQGLEHKLQEKQEQELKKQKFQNQAKVTTTRTKITKIGKVPMKCMESIPEEP